MDAHIGTDVSVGEIDNALARRIYFQYAVKFAIDETVDIVSQRLAESDVDSDVTVSH